MKTAAKILLVFCLLPTFVAAKPPKIVTAQRYSRTVPHRRPPAILHFFNHQMTPIPAGHYLTGPNNLTAEQTAGLALDSWKGGLNDPTLHLYPCGASVTLLPTANPQPLENTITTAPLGPLVVALTTITVGQGTPPDLKRNWSSYSGSSTPSFPVTYTNRGTIALSTSVPFGEAGQLSSFRYDLRTVLEHELGHLLGLLDNTFAASIMNGSTINQGPSTVAVTAADKQRAWSNNCF